MRPHPAGGLTPFDLDLAEAFIADITITQGLQGDTAKRYLLAVGLLLFDARGLRCAARI